MPGKRLLLDTNAIVQLLSGKICAVRFSSGLKLPDAIIAGTAIHNECVVVTADVHFNKLKEPWHVLNYTPKVLK